ncbi:MAG: thymidine kinase [Candidatus Izemoplasmatales bacterium]|jgi:thymidine kinase|nr:thymidine kinase [Candidatus Izemoplasmatales bacterium]MDD4354849.1 thymidine kinase [Candidatus Izemoplasmatales bacterium]MDD4988110.1 thymidine kinase [Candidatus Izemoplasmatales bacterium]MDY0374076.1 thymidine kinase [Candidatus Izemoplasmatales bacterium]NLF48763.1 thymidine kinase [Acholeplasmataceae bacterium]
MNQTKREGWIEVITGPMFAGKTEELIRRVRRLEYAKKHIIVFKPTIDTRYTFDEVVSHNNTRTKSICITKAREIMDYVTEETEVVAIDEIQFLDEEACDICEYLADKGLRVIVSGLDRNFRGEPFSFMPRLLALAEDVIKLTAICVKCQAPATRTQRIINNRPANVNDPIILVGAQDSYEARCRHCHEVPGKPKSYDRSDKE